MSDQVRVTNMPDSGSPQRVAFELFTYLRSLHPNEGEPAVRAQKLLLFYGECLRTVHGGTPDITNLK